MHLNSYSLVVLTACLKSSHYLNLLPRQGYFIVGLRGFSISQEVHSPILQKGGSDPPPPVVVGLMKSQMEIYL